MKEKILKLIEHFLQRLAKKKIQKANPKIVAITGSYGKTSAKEAVFKVLHDKFGNDVGKNWGNMNSTLGLPLAILGLKNYSFGIGLVINLIEAVWNALFYKLPKVLVLELGIDKPGEMSELLSFVKPDIAVITGISETHLEQLKTVEGVKREKDLLFKSLKTGGVAIRNSEDPSSENLTIGKGVKEITFGANGLVSATEEKTTVRGTDFTLNYFGQTEKISSKLIGRHVINNLLIAAAVASVFDFSLDEIKKTLEEVVPEKGRMNPIEVKDLYLIDDSYNSNPKSAEAALESIAEINHKGRKIAVLGNMNELGNYTRQGHIRVGKAAGKIADLLIAVGDNAETLASGARESGMVQEKIITFASTSEIISKIDQLLVKGDLVLIKGSQNRVRLEKLVKYLMKNDQLAEKILVRQEKKWQGK